MATKTRQSTEFVRAKEPFSGTHDGEPFVVNPTEVFAADHPLVREYGDRFRPLEPNRQRPDVEQTTAAPGEKRDQPKRSAPSGKAKSG